jgi:NAD(P)-dependent dehydrogenase (short-subunit alcohol dehydrogenase family)
VAQRAAIVTGGSSGIGLAIARVLGEEGHGLTVAARRPEKLEEAVAGLRADGFDVNAVSGNLADEGLVQEVVRSHRERFGRLDVLVNNASISGKSGEAWLSVYSATKAAVVGFTQAMHKEQVKAEDMIQVSDVAEVVRVLLKQSPGCIVPEVQFLRPGDRL